MKKIDNLMLFLLELRGLIRRVYQWKERKEIRKNLLEWLLVVTIFSTYLFLLCFPDHTSVFGLIFIVIMLIYSILFGLQSCSSFFYVWILSMVAALCIAKGMGIDDHIAKLCAIIFAALSCMFIGALANYDTTKLVTNIINTLTTLAVMIVNVLAAWSFTQGKLSDSGLANAQFCVNLGVLPYAIVGYMTALFKDIQLYWENHYLGDISPEAGIVRIQDWIYNAK